MTTALIALGNELRRDDGIAAELCRNLPVELRERLAYFELGIHGDKITDCLKGARKAIVVDAVSSSTEPGRMTIIECGSLDNYRANIRASHGFSWFHELALVANKVPITFVGVSVTDDSWGTGLSNVMLAAKGRLSSELAAVCSASLEQDNE